MKAILFWLFYSIGSSPILFASGVVAIAICILATRKIRRGPRLKWRVGVTAVTVLVLSATSAWECHRLASPAVDHADYAAVKEGMTAEEVARLLGQSSTKRSVPREQASKTGARWSDRDLTIWRYDKLGVWEFVEIYFDENGKVVFKNMDS